MAGNPHAAEGIRVFVHTAVDGYAWQDVPPALAQSLQACLDAAGTFPGGSASRGPQAAGGVIRCSVSGVGGTAVYRYHRRIAGDFRGRDSHYVAFAFFPAEAGAFDLRKVWNAPAMRAPADGGFGSLQLRPGEWEGSVGDFSSGEDRNALAESRSFVVSGPDAPERIAEAFQSGAYGVGALNCALFESADGALTGECVYEVFPEVAAEGKARAAFQAVHPYSVAAKRAALDDWKSAVDALEAKAKRLSSLPGMKTIADAARRAFDAAAASCSWMQRPASGGVSFEASPAGAHRGPSRPPARPGIRPRGGEGSRDPAPSPGRRSFPSLVLLFFASFLGVFVVVAVVAWLFLKGDEKQEGGGGSQPTVTEKQGNFPADEGRQDDEKTGRQESAPLSPSGQEAAGEEDQGGGGLQTAVSPQGGESEEKAARKAAEEAARKAAEEAARKEAEKEILRLKRTAAELAQTVEPYRKWADDGEFKSRFDDLDKEKSALDALSSASGLPAATDHFARIKSAADWMREKGAEREKQDKSQIEIWEGYIATLLESISPFREKKESESLKDLFRQLDDSKKKFDAAREAVELESAQAEYDKIESLVKKINQVGKSLAAAKSAKPETRNPNPESVGNEFSSSPPSGPAVAQKPAAPSSPAQPQKSAVSPPPQEGGGLPTAEGSAGHVDGTAAKSAKPETRIPNPAVAQKPAAPSSPAQPQKSAVSPPPQGGGGLQTAVSPSPAMVPPAKISQDEILTLRDNAEKAVERKRGLGPLAPPRFDTAFFKKYGDIVQKLRLDLDDADYSGPWLAYSAVTNECAPFLAQLKRVRDLKEGIREKDVPKPEKELYSKGCEWADQVESFIKRGNPNGREPHLKLLSAAVQNLERVQKAIDHARDEEKDRQETEKQQKKDAKRRKKELEQRRTNWENKIHEWESGGWFGKSELYKMAEEAGWDDPSSFEKEMVSSHQFQNAKKWLAFDLESGRTVKEKWYSPEDCLDQVEAWFERAEALVCEKLGTLPSAPTPDARKRR